MISQQLKQFGILPILEDLLKDLEEIFLFLVMDQNIFLWLPASSENQEKVPRHLHVVMALTISDQMVLISILGQFLELSHSLLFGLKKI